MLATLWPVLIIQASWAAQSDCDACPPSVSVTRAAGSNEYGLDHAVNQSEIAARLLPCKNHPRNAPLPVDCFRLSEHSFSWPTTWALRGDKELPILDLKDWCSVYNNLTVPRVAPETFTLMTPVLTIPLTVAHAATKFYTQSTLSALHEFHVHMIGATVHFEANQLATITDVLSQLLRPLRVSLVLIGESNAQFGLPRWLHHRFAEHRGVTVEFVSSTYEKYRRSPRFRSPQLAIALHIGCGYAHPHTLLDAVAGIPFVISAFNQEEFGAHTRLHWCWSGNKFHFGEPNAFASLVVRRRENDSKELIENQFILGGQSRQR